MSEKFESIEQSLSQIRDIISENKIIDTHAPVEAESVSANDVYILRNKDEKSSLQRLTPSDYLNASIHTEVNKHIGPIMDRWIQKHMGEILQTRLNRELNRLFYDEEEA